MIGSARGRRGRLFRARPRLETDRRKRQQQRQPDKSGGGGRRATERPPVAHGIEDGPQPVLDAHGPAHRQGDGRGEAARGQVRRDGEQVFRIVGGTGPGVEHGVVAGAFLFDAEPADRQPGERVEPVERPRQVADHLGQTIQTPDVGQFVQHDHAQPLR